MRSLAQTIDLDVLDPAHGQDPGGTLAMLARARPAPVRERIAANPRATITELRAVVAEHPLWTDRFMRACSMGQLSKDNWRLFFGQYYFYSREFTRYLAGLLASCENDMLRARLIENLWEEGGGCDPDRRHAEIFRRFLREGLGLVIEQLEPLPPTQQFVRQVLDFCGRSHPASASMFLALGTEGIVARMYETFLAGLVGAGIADAHLEFFRIHIECDDGHAETLEDIAASYATVPGWAGLGRQAVEHALELRRRFFDSMFEAMHGGCAA